MTFLTKEKDFNLLYFLSPGARGARQEPPPRGGPGGSAFSAGLGGLLDGPMGAPRGKPHPSPQHQQKFNIKDSNFVYVLELCMFSMNFHLVCVCLGLPSTAVHLYLWGKDLDIVTRLSVLNQSFPI